MEGMAELLAEKDRLESRISQLEARLGEISGDGRLVDEEGFPVAHLPIIEIRQLRHDLACLHNDHKGVMQEIESVLPAALQQQQQQPNQPGPCIGRVGRVEPGSAAHQAGVFPGDLVLGVGEANRPDQVKAAMEEARRVGRVQLRVWRPSGPVCIDVDLKGKATLGCHLDLHTQ